MNQTVMDWSDDLKPMAFIGLARLENASDRGAMAADIVRRFGLLDVLSDFQPVIVGTLPLAIDTPGSDIDILCNTPDLSAFRQLAEDQLGQHDGFRVHMRPATKHVPGALVVRFSCDDLPVEIFACDRPTAAQYGFIHMLVEARILAITGPEFAVRIRQLKHNGIKTEPAFAQLLGLDGDPYIALAQLAELSPSELRDILPVCDGP